MGFVTHELLLTGQGLALLAYTLASYRIGNRRFGTTTTIALVTGIALDSILAVLGANSNLGHNPQGTPWGHPLFLVAVTAATSGMFAYVLCFPVLVVRSWRESFEDELVRAQPYIWGLWVIGVAIFIVNVSFQWF